MLLLISCIASVVAVPAGGAESSLLSTLDPSALRALVVQHDGRYQPLDTAARDVVRAVTGDSFFRDRDPLLRLLSWMFDPPSWMREPLITIRNQELRRELALPADQTVFSYLELVNHGRLQELIGTLAQRGGKGKPNPLESKVSDIHDKLTVLQNVFRSRIINLLPNPSDSTAAWAPIAEHAAGEESMSPLAAAWSSLRDAFLRDDAAAFAAASKELVAQAHALPAAFRPSAKMIDLEIRYNQLQPYSLAWKVMLGAAALAGAAAMLRRRWFDGVAFVAMIAGFGVLTYGLWMRWQIAERIPASNLFESLLFLSWGMGAFAIVSMLVFRDRLVPLTASGMGAVALILADCLPMDHFIRPIAPVLLDTVWMSIHVPIIMVSYSVLALAVLIAHLQLLVMAGAPRRVEASKTLDTLHYWYVHVGSILLTVGIITGSMWAASSWGRYWGWDPKEVWSLAALLGYLAVLHVRIDPARTPRWAYVVAVVLLIGLCAAVLPRFSPMSGDKVLALLGAVVGMAVLVLARGAFGTAVKSILCFWMIVMTYVGVNFVLGIGLHSYGFGTGAVALYMLTMGAADLSFVGVCAAVYLARRSAAKTASRVAPALA